MNVTYSEAAVLHFSHYGTGTSLDMLLTDGTFIITLNAVVSESVKETEQLNNQKVEFIQ